MSMHVENLRVIASIQNGLRTPDDPDDAPRTAHFIVDGHALVAVANPATGEPPADTRGLVVGRIICAGTRYLIYDAEPEPELDDTPAAADVLTRRELQIATLIGDGKSDKEIALKLGISGYTVREHIRRIFAKLNICRRAAIVSHVLRHRSASPY